VPGKLLTESIHTPESINMASSSTSRVSVTRIDIPGTPEPSWAEMILQVPQEIRLGKEGFEELWNEHPAEKGKVKIFGKRDPSFPAELREVVHILWHAAHT
jgi:hypothetical protein